MKILGYEIRKIGSGGITVEPTTSAGLPYSSLATTLSTEENMKLSAVYRCVDLVSSSMAVMPWDIYSYKGESSEWTKDEFHPSSRLLNVEPNKAVNKFTFMKTLCALIELDGNAYVRILRDASGNPTELDLLIGFISMYLRKDNTIYYIFTDIYTNEIVYIDGDDMLHFKNFSYDGYLGVSTLTHAANITGLAASADAQAKGYYSNGVNMNGIVSVPGKISSERAADLKKSWSDSVGYNSLTGLAGGVVILEGGAQFTPIQVNPRDAQMLETRAFNVIDICRFFGVPPIKCFDPSGNSYAGNIEASSLAFLNDAMLPRKINIENEFNRKLLRPSQRNTTKMMLDEEMLLSADIQSKAAYWSQLFNMGAISPNEISKKAKTAVKSDGGQRYIQVNVAPIGQKPEPIQNKNNGSNG